MSARRVAALAACAVLAVTLGLAAAAPAIAQTESPNEHSSGELVEKPKDFDGTRVAFTGEVVGEAMVRGGYAWIHINDDAYYLENVEEGAKLGGYNSGMAVWVPANLVQPIEHFGDYKNEGDVVTVEGTFNAACGEHGGDMDIHAESLRVDVVGHAVVDPIHPWKLVLAIVGVIASAGAWYVHRVRSRQTY